MAYLMIHHKVEDFAKWKPFFTHNDSARKSAGSKGGQVFRSKSDPNEVVILFEWDKVENAQKFATSPELAALMKEAGVINRPDAFFLEEIEKVSA